MLTMLSTFTSILPRLAIQDLVMMKVVSTQFTGKMNFPKRTR